MKLLKQSLITTAQLSAAMLTGAPALAAEKLSMATSWGGGPPLESWAKGFANTVEDLTAGEVEIEVFTAGTLGSPLKVAQQYWGHPLDISSQAPIRILSQVNGLGVANC